MIEAAEHPDRDPGLATFDGQPTNLGQTKPPKHGQFGRAGVASH
jgi:hypothetical protein